MQIIITIIDYTGFGLMTATVVSQLAVRELMVYIEFLSSHFINQGEHQERHITETFQSHSHIMIKESFKYMY